MKLPSIDFGWNAGTVAIGVAAYLFGPAALSAAGGVLRGAAKSGIKGGMIAYHRGRQLTEEARASLQDMSEEARSEIKRLQEKAESAAQKQASE
jgi:hypothetical protein